MLPISHLAPLKKWFCGLLQFSSVVPLSAVDDEESKGGDDHDSHDLNKG